MPKKILVGYGIDVDAVSGWIDTQDGSQADPVDISRGIFGATVGIDRLLKLFDKYKIKCSWFVPAHTMETFPGQIAKIRDSGHEIGLHGYTHEHVSRLTPHQERAVLQKSISVLTQFCHGVKPLGFTAPAWTCSPQTIHILEEAGIQYDHSFMHHDCQLYHVPYSDYGTRATDYKRSATEPEQPDWLQPMPAPRTSSVVEVPANWHLDDWPPFQPGDGGSNGFVDPHHIERFWREHFDYCYREHDDFVFPMSIHPQVSAKPQILLMHERLIEYISGKEGVEWCTFAQMVKRYKDGLVE